MTTAAINKEGAAVPHPDYVAAPAAARWDGSAIDLMDTLKREAYRLKGDWAWRVTTGGLLVALRVPLSFQKQLRIARRVRDGINGNLAGAWHAEVRALLEEMKCANWKPTRDSADPGDPPKLEALFEEPVPLRSPTTLRCSRCGQPAEPGSDKYKETICNRCATELGSMEAQARSQARQQASGQ